MCNNLKSLDDKSIGISKQNYNNEMSHYFGEVPTIYVDDSDINKDTAFKFEDVALVKDGSAKDVKIGKGYNVAEAVVITEKMKQPISLVSHIYSSKSKGFISANEVTLNNIDEVKRMIERKCLFVFDRGYDANVYYEKFLNEMIDDFIIRVKCNRNLHFKETYKCIINYKREEGQI